MPFFVLRCCGTSTVRLACRGVDGTCCAQLLVALARPLLHGMACHVLRYGMPCGMSCTQGMPCQPLARSHSAQCTSPSSCTHACVSTCANTQCPLRPQHTQDTNTAAHHLLHGAIRREIGKKQARERGAYACRPGPTSVQNLSKYTNTQPHICAKTPTRQPHSTAAESLQNTHTALPHGDTNALLRKRRRCGCGSSQVWNRCADREIDRWTDIQRDRQMDRYTYLAPATSEAASEARPQPARRWRLSSWRARATGTLQSLPFHTVALHTCVRPARNTPVTAVNG